MDDEIRQYSLEARAGYQGALASLLETLQAHARLTLSDEGRQREWAAYNESASRVREALRSYADAELEWCGSTPLTLVEWDDEEDDEGKEEKEQLPAGYVLSVLGRFDYSVHDRTAVIMAGRRAYLELWPTDTEDDAEFRVDTVDQGVLELLGKQGTGWLDDIPGMSLDRYTWVTLIHEGHDDFDSDPFRIARQPRGLP